ncbi:MAG: T9SS type A sorting domain-containing protein [Prevotella sp.]|nr:T9SS type A sorting domain-containing protein [Prevotella sp.]
MKKTFLTLLLCLSTTLWVHAQQQEIIINGQPLEKTVVQLTFSGDNVILLFDDNSTQSTDMGDLSIRFIDDGTTDIRQLQTFRMKQLVDGRLEIEGITAGTAIFIYDTTGKILLRTVAVEDITILDISSLKKGIYFIKTGKQIIKFIKR